MPEAIVALGEGKRVVGRLRFESDGRRQHFAVRVCRRVARGFRPLRTLSPDCLCVREATTTPERRTGARRCPDVLPMPRRIPGDARS